MKINIKYLNYFRPNIFINSISEINVSSLKAIGIKCVLCDLDNTLVPHFTKKPNNIVFSFVNELRNNDIKFIVCSNNTKKRVEEFCSFLDIDDFIYNCKKPFTRKIKKILEKHNIELEDTILVGDKFFTDVFAANRLMIKSILVLPLVDSIEKRFQNLIVYLIEKLLYKFLGHDNLRIKKSQHISIDEYDYI